VRLPVAAIPAPGSAPEPGDASRIGLRILLVEDDLAAGNAMQRLLESHGHTVRLARSASDAEREASASFDVLIVDLQLPDGSGLDLLPRLRVHSGANGRSEGPPAIVLSGSGRPVDLERCRLAGFTAHLVKPVTVGELLDVIGQVTQPVGGQPAN
jgi:CheY-like chemotaxis protein